MTLLASGQEVTPHPAEVPLARLYSEADFPTSSRIIFITYKPYQQSGAYCCWADSYRDGKSSFTRRTCTPFSP